VGLEGCIINQLRADSSVGRAESLYLSGRGFESLSAHILTIIDIVMKKSSHTRVSFILPTRNRPEFVREALNGARKYVTAQDELLVIDASKDDQTQKVVKQFKDIVTGYFRTTDISEGHKINIGILNSQGRIIKPITDDDAIVPSGLKKAIETLDTDETLDALQCGGESYLFNEKTKKFDFCGYARIPSDIHIQHDFFGLMLNNCCHPGLLFKRRVLPLIGLYDKDFVVADLDIMSKMIKAQVSFKYLDVCIFHHIQYKHSSELQDLNIGRDKVKIGFSLPQLDAAFWEEPICIKKALQLKESRENTGFVWLLKNAYQLKASLPGRMILRGIGFFIREKKISNVTNTHLIPTQRTPAHWTGKYW
jgi:glycosyltransferase involved in cell wall biosynthesis